MEFVIYGLVLIVALGVLCWIIKLLWKLISFLVTTTIKVLKSIFSVFTLSTSTVNKLPVESKEEVTKTDSSHKTNENIDLLREEIERLKLINKKLTKENIDLENENKKLKQELKIIKAEFEKLKELVEKSKKLQDKINSKIAEIIDIAVENDKVVQFLIAAIEALEQTAKKLRPVPPPLPPRPFPDIGTVTVISSNVYSDDYIDELEWYIEYLLLRLYKESSKARFLEEPEYSQIIDIANRLDLVDFFMYQVPDAYEEV